MQTPSTGVPASAKRRIASIETPASAGRARPGRHDHARRLAREQLVHGLGVVAHDVDLGPQLAQVLDEVVGERVVVVDDQRRCRSYLTVILTGMRELSRREVIAAGAAAGALLALERLAPRRLQRRRARHRRIDFAGQPDGGRAGAAGWRSTGVANLRRAGGVGLLEAGSDVFPNDPRPVAFAVDCRIRDGEVAATITATGSAPGVVLRRTVARVVLRGDLRHGTRARFASCAGTAPSSTSSRAQPVPGVEPPITLTLAADRRRADRAAGGARRFGRRLVRRRRRRRLRRRCSARATPACSRRPRRCSRATRTRCCPALGNLHLLP